MSIDLSRVKPYGDTLNDGAIQFSFSLPVPSGDEAKEAAKQLTAQMGIVEPQVYHMKDLGEGYTFFIVYGKCEHTVDFSNIRVPKVESSVMNFYEINAFIREKIGRKLVVLGACTGTDAHTVGIDAIMNMKGYNFEYGLERYPEIDAYNLGSQVENETMVAKAIEMDADVLLVSQVVTQKGVHITNLTELVEIVEAEGIRERLILICGGPRINHELALELGYDAGFGPGTLAPGVASYFVEEIYKRIQQQK
ncbi:cobalamin B12-binding domain-containing protein [Hazenella sp. IB182357]|uniref:Cobalamin B12-binding domain-containing protein n=1 Tax=Polycladospora coralii TaxID=2771432 RepID=A0A926RTS5_9BACL|nr:OAM dimerization domain-containing protein [Polycladospora coralii]MBD1372058.1 cobalamin B12-binding domain-containing protein [Polycladospora coralii]MBS7530564.1 cobalamin-dependent protein [Polycladospora coralii]